jgi:hypothetical protein
VVAFWMVGVLGFGCAHQSVRAGKGEFEGDRYVNPQLGFELARPERNWQLDPTEEAASQEGKSIPVVLRHAESGAQVFIHVAPAIATPTQYAERLNFGLRSYPGFTTSDPEPLPLSDDAVGFSFAMGDKVQGRVAVREGGSGQVFTLMATWPSDASQGLMSEVDQIFGSVRPIPHG